MTMHRILTASALALLCALAAAPSGAQEAWLIDEFALEASWRSNDLDTTVRIDGPNDLGTEFNIEDVLGLATDEENVGVAVEWRLGRRHLLTGSWASYERDRRQTISRTIEIGDTTFPVNIDTLTEFDIETITLGYTYYLVVKDRLAFGLGGGLRQYDFRLALSAAQGQLSLAESAEVSGPMPFVGIDYRYALSNSWRLRGKVGLFDIEIDEYSGSQILGELAVEFLALEHLSFGLAGDVGQLDVDVDGGRWQGAIDSDIVGLRAFARVLW